MYLIALPDLHGDTRDLPLLANEFARADAVILAGDLTTGGSPDGAIRIVETLRRYTDRILAICGNWDTPATAAYISAEGINLEDEPYIIGQTGFLGVGWALRSGIGSPNEYTEAEFAKRLTALELRMPEAQSLVFVCHQPPAQTRCDRTSLGQPVGSQAVRDFLERVQPRVCLTGHIHEGIGVDQVDQTTVVNPGLLWMSGYAMS
jgi:Icc-related predicted phosphoesterase